MIKFGSAIAFIGLLNCFIFNTNMQVFALSMFLYSLGLGIFNALIMRLVITIPNLPQGMLTSLMVFTQTNI